MDDRDVFFLGGSSVEQKTHAKAVHGKAEPLLVALVLRGCFRGPHARGKGLQGRDASARCKFGGCDRLIHETPPALMAKF